MARGTPVGVWRLAWPNEESSRTRTQNDLWLKSRGNILIMMEWSFFFFFLLKKKNEVELMKRLKLKTNKKRLLCAASRLNQSECVCRRRLIDMFMSYELHYIIIVIITLNQYECVCFRNKKNVVRWYWFTSALLHLHTCLSSSHVRI